MCLNTSVNSPGSLASPIPLLGIPVAISRQTNCHCGPKAASKRKASLPTWLSTGEPIATLRQGTRGSLRSKRYTFNH